MERKVAWVEMLACVKCVSLETVFWDSKIGLHKFGFREQMENFKLSGDAILKPITAQLGWIIVS